MTSSRPKSSSRATALAVGGVASLLTLGVLTGLVPPVAGVLVLWLALSYLYWLMRSHISSILLVFFGVMLLATIVSQPAPKLAASEAGFSDSSDSLVERWSGTGSFNEELPIVLHILFDELMSPGAMTDDLPGGAESRQVVYDFGERYSFRTFDAVYSRQFFSNLSIWNLMNTEYRGHLDPAALASEFHSKDSTNAYFDDMAERGYQTVVFQSSFFGFCTNKNVLMCETFDSFDPRWSDVQTYDLKTRKVHLWDTLLRSYGSSYTSKYGRRLLSAVYGLDDGGGAELGAAGRFDVQMFPNTFQQFTNFAARVPRGSHIFAHFMVPHSPYQLTESCVVSGVEDGGYYLGKRFALEAERADARQRYYAQYLAQVGCVMRSLDVMMRQLVEAESYQDAKIVIHGDHGSRISVGKFVERYAGRDFVDNYATYFAVRSPDVEPGVDCELISLPEVFRRYLGASSAKPRQGGRPALIVDTEKGDGSKVEATMPAFGCAVQGGQRGSTVAEAALSAE